MTDSERNQLRRRLIEQFHQMQTEELTPIPEEFRSLLPPMDWDLRF